MADIAKGGSAAGKSPINWNNETKDTFRKIGKIALKVLTYVMNVLLTILLILFFIGIIVGTTFALYVKNYVDADIEASLLVGTGTNRTTQLYYTDSETGEDYEIEDQRIYGANNGIWVEYGNIPDTLIDAFVAIEDHRFFSHNGVDWMTTSKAVFNYFLKITREFGASTITQQLVKNITGDDEVKITRKVQEIFRALNLETDMSKEQILELYLNVVYFGNNCTGVQTAADTYFGKSLDELTIAECATLAGLVKNPYAYNPINFPEESVARRNDVIYAMEKYGKISKAEAEEAYNEPLVLADDDDSGESVSSPESNVFNWYTEAVFNEVQNDLMEKYGYSKYSAGMAIYTGGLKIYTCMDPEVQKVLEDIYTNDTDYFPMSSSSMQPESAMTIIDPYTGNVLGLVGGRGEKVSNRILNRATDTLRPPGSSIKPVSVYAPAVDAGIINYATVYDDVPVKFGDPENPVAWPANLPYVYRGLTNINSGIERSVNTIAVQVLQDLTPQASYEFVTEKLGFTSVYDSVTLASGAVKTDIDLSPLALGQLTYGISVKELTAAYSIFPNNGIFNKPRLYTKVVDSNRETILSCERETDIVISEQTAGIMTKMLYNVVNDWEGTAYGSVTLKNSIDVAGKTGTSTADFDRWFVGYTPYYVGGVWVGYDSNIALSAFGANPACQIWDQVMTRLHQKFIDAAANGGEPLKTFETPAGLIEAEYCRDSGKLMTDACRLDLRGDRSETGWFAYGDEPSEYCDRHVKVKYCTVSHAVASPNCDNTTEVSLVRIDDRSFPIQIQVEDARYAYRDLPDGVEPGGWWGVPFFINTLKPGEFCGVSNVTYMDNAYCWMCK